MNIRIESSKNKAQNRDLDFSKLKTNHSFPGRIEICRLAAQAIEHNNCTLVWQSSHSCLWGEKFVQHLPSLRYHCQQRPIDCSNQNCKYKSPKVKLSDTNYKYKIAPRSFFRPLNPGFRQSESSSSSCYELVFSQNCIRKKITMSSIHLVSIKLGLSPSP